MQADWPQKLTASAGPRRNAYAQADKSGCKQFVWPLLNELNQTQLRHATTIVS